ncbi:MAG: RagB/SusD family nutrient uptake outer membrane protein [Bacteroidales bacterium]|nr:RagB/SusD family nutrient uptake outer membrane protein [Bacteroidales bacterium]
MKKNMILAAAAIFALTACTDNFLTVEHPTESPLEEYFSTEEHLQEAVIAAYDPLEWFDWTEEYDPLNILSDVMADQIWVGGSDKSDNKFWHLIMNYEAIPNSTVTGLWSDCYSGVKRCNDVLQYKGWVKGLSDDTAKLVEAQARVLRVFYYNILWKFWGNIPYYEENLSGDFTCQQFKADEVYAKMIADLEGAIALNALPMFWTGDDQGRVSKAMAYMLYAEITMYQNDATRLSKALDYMKEIISESHYELLPDYTVLFKEEGEWGSETIFDINYKDDNAVRGWAPANNPRAAGGTILPRMISPNGWTGDSEHDAGWGFAPVRTETYDMYDAADKRRDATCWNIGAGNNYNPRYQDTGIFLEKYVAYKANNADQVADGDLNFNNNLRIYRYAETLLNAAELVVRGYGSGDAANWLNKVHGRALAGTTVDLTLENIKKERALEFVGEGKRYWDLVRWELTNDADGIQASKVLVPDSYGYRTNSWTASKKYIPIPQGEIDSAEGKSWELTQNNY